MQLFITETSAYARMARILLREKSLLPRVDEVIARTRQKDSPYYEINVSGRVPYLVLPDGTGFEGSRLILKYLDQLDDTPILKPAEDDTDWEFARLEEAARGLMDGLSVWTRELKRPMEDRSQAVLEHEKERAARVIARWETEIDHPIMQGSFNYPQLTLACGLCLDQWYPYFEWRTKHPMLAQWLKPFETRPSFLATVPPPALSID